MSNEITIPILPCVSINDTLEFYVALGFEITYQQTRPNPYACVRRGGIELHFFTMRNYDDPAKSYSSCFVSVSEADVLHQAFAAGLRQHYGKIPVAGIPRITKPNNNNSAGDRRFNVIDPGGNWIRFGQKADILESDENVALQKAESTKLSRALRAADLLATSKGDAIAAAKLLDKALAHEEPVSTTQRLQALVLRTELAITMGDPQLASSILTEIRHIPLDDEERAALVDELERANDLEHMLRD
jgi:catechol 2,3-dioxygenase-like lactoylglutathione lyase family enzyme